ncbi:carbon-nitrogen hydrolase family protein [Sphingomonas sp.]|uniref:carbon-nitrogen hydrolase family protein n=1 Tax=Sphingomonas sp. TaxID=28214 RepID=UPI002BA73AEB|nr:carbon-nitrogen hydrolase family protein [Sphingomonas sp.]HTG39126.1 carbon-nitrogen hydrolase family protein [Sphingomonas sp.]
MKIALLQMTGVLDPVANAATVADAVAHAGRGGATMLFTPEMSNLIDRDRNRSASKIVAEHEDPVLQAVGRAAYEYGVWVHLGSLAVRRPDGRFANRSILIDDRGIIRARYDKLHMFDADVGPGNRWQESSAFAAGDRAVVAATPAGQLGMTICYDLRFPALYQALGEAGAELLAVPAAFTRATGEAHWESLIRARAIENGCFVIAAAQTGDHEDGRLTYGRSLVVDPWGDVLLDMGVGPRVDFVVLDEGAVASARARIPAMTHRRAIPPVERVGA